MGVMQFNIPDDVQKAVEAAFQGAEADKDSIVAEALRKAALDRAQAAPGRGLVEMMRKLRASGPSFTAEEIRQARDELRS